MRSRSSQIQWCAMLLFVLLAKQAMGAPDTARAAAMDRQARVLFEKGDFAGAARNFADAYQAAPHPATKYNEAMAWEQGGDLPRAADAYAVALEGGALDEDRTKEARERLKELEQVLAQVLITGPAELKVSVAHIKVAPVPVQVHLLPGTHEVILHGQGRRAIRNVQAAEGQRVTVVLELMARPAPPTTSPVPASRDSAARTGGWVALGGAGVLSMTAGYLGYKTLDSLDQYEDSGYRDAELRDKTENYKLWTNVAWAAAGVSASVGLLLLLSSSDGSSSTVSLQLAPLELKADYAF